jgi:hypothetical protein
MPGPGAARRKRGTGNRRERSIVMPIEACDGVRAGGVVVDVHVADHRRCLRSGLRRRSVDGHDHRDDPREDRNNCEAKLRHSASTS